jgi:hypothetical protein
VYPSPNNGTFTVNGTLTINEDALIDVIDFTGKVVYNHSVEVSNRKIDARISLGAGITPGLYILRITQSGIQTRTVFSVL